MGTEIIILFLPVPLLIWVYNIWRVLKGKHRRRHISLLLMGIGAMSYIPAHVYLSGSPAMQGILVGCFFYLPYYLLCWLFLFVVGHLAPSSKLNVSIT
jgi:EamA domain-containing membrane protein RarD